jgi:hypothetical protein
MNEPLSLIPIVKLSRDALKALSGGAAVPPGGTASDAPTVGGTRDTARALVDLYYRMQEERKALANQVGAINRGADTGGALWIEYTLKQIEVLEDNAASFLETYAWSHEMGPWLQAVHGIGPVLAAGLLAHLTLQPTVGHWWRFAGLDPHQKWLGKDDLKTLWAEQEGDIETRARIVAGIVGRNPETVLRDATTDFRTGEVKGLTKDGAIKALARIPFNRPLKTLCWKIGDSFVKLGSREDAYYARYYRQRKAEEIARNLRGDRAELAARTLADKPMHAQRAIYAEGRLPDGRIDLMARRATVKLFLSHMHEVWWRVEHGTAPPKPFSIAVLGHGHYLPPPYLEAIGQAEAA